MPKLPMRCLLQQLPKRLLRHLRRLLRLRPVPRPIFRRPRHNHRNHPEFPRAAGHRIPTAVKRIGISRAMIADHAVRNAAMTTMPGLPAMKATIATATFNQETNIAATGTLNPGRSAARSTFPANGARRAAMSAARTQNQTISAAAGRLIPTAVKRIAINRAMIADRAGKNAATIPMLVLPAMTGVRIWNQTISGTSGIGHALMTDRVSRVTAVSVDLNGTVTGSRPCSGASSPIKARVTMADGAIPIRLRRKRIARECMRILQRVDPVDSDHLNSGIPRAIHRRVMISRRLAPCHRFWARSIPITTASSLHRKLPVPPTRLPHWTKIMTASLPPMNFAQCRLTKALRAEISALRGPVLARKGHTAVRLTRKTRVLPRRVSSRPINKVA
ncbi:MAG: hypothetical protein JWL90_3459 [Chthoniobacteraceae bacterium]|nr:hypothetical protein [Chthoniobacteraceae bacterium]